MKIALCPTRFQHLRAAKHRIETVMTPLSRSVLNLTGLIAVATKLGIRRRGAPEGNAADVFLQTMQAPVSLLAGLMADAGAEVMGLFRGFDTVNIFTTEKCGSISDFVSLFRWLFDEQSAFLFQVNGHTSYLANWLCNPHFVDVRGEGQCIGGIYVLAAEHAAMRDQAMSHLMCWLGLAQHTLNAEFPSFDLAQSMFAFDLRGARCTTTTAGSSHALVGAQTEVVGHRVQDAFLAA
jgi:hypothetical protein